MNTATLDQPDAPEVAFSSVARLDQDLLTASRLMTKAEIRYLVDSYYSLQEYRKATSNQQRASGEAGEPALVLGWLLDQTNTLEGQIKRALSTWTDHDQVSAWAKSIVGIGPVISAGLRAHIDMNQAPTVGHIWRFAGLDPTRTWTGRDAAAKLVEDALTVTEGDLEEAVVRAAIAVNTDAERLMRRATTGRDGEAVKLTKASLASALAVRPWNARLKVLCWKIGESFVKVQANENDVYGRIYVERKARETQTNLTGGYADQAANILVTKRVGKDTEAYAAYSKGQLPKAQIHARAKRYSVKLFLAHWHAVAHEVEFGTKPPKPYILTRPEHTHYMGPPGWPMA